MSETKEELTIICGWCRTLIQQAGPKVSHTICEKCFEKEMDKMDAEEAKQCAK